MEIERLDFNKKPDEKLMARKVVERIRQFANQYQAMNSMLKGHLYLNQPYPLCVWDAQLLEVMRRRGQVGFGCQLLSSSGIVFGVDGRLAPCNAMVQHPFLRQFTPVNGPDSFFAVRNSLLYQKMIGELKSYAAEDCIACESFATCRGGCPMQWFQYDYTTLMDSTSSRFFGEGIDEAVDQKPSLDHCQTTPDSWSFD